MQLDKLLPLLLKLVVLQVNKLKALNLGLDLVTMALVLYNHKFYCINLNYLLCFFLSHNFAYEHCIRKFKGKRIKQIPLYSQLEVRNQADFMKKKLRFIV